jgi:hypothetical protein
MFLPHGPSSSDTLPDTIIELCRFFYRLELGSSSLNKFTLFSCIRVSAMLYEYSQRGGVVCGSLILICEVVTVKCMGRG